MADAAKQLDALLRQHGFKLVPGCKKHLVYKSVGLGGRIFVMSATPSDSYHGAKNALADLRRVIASPPRAEILAIEDYERARAAQIGLQKTERAGAGVGSGRNHSSRGTGFIYVSKEVVELTPEQIAEKEQRREKRQAEEAAFKARRQQNREEREAHEVVMARVEAAVNRGVDMWAERAGIIQEGLNDRFLAGLVKTRDTFSEEFFATVRAEHNSIIEKIKKHGYNDDIADALAEVGNEVWHAVVAISNGYGVDQALAQLDKSIKAKWVPDSWIVPTSIAPRIRRALEAWFRALEFGYDDTGRDLPWWYRSNDDDRLTGLKPIFTTLNRARFPQPADIVAQLKAESDLEDVEVGVAFEREKPGEKNVYEFCTDVSESDLDAAYEDDCTPLSLVAFDPRHGRFFLKPFPMPQPTLDYCIVEIAAELESLSGLKYCEGWPEHVEAAPAAEVEEFAIAS